MIGFNQWTEKGGIGENLERQREEVAGFCLVILFDASSGCFNGLFIQALPTGTLTPRLDRDSALTSICAHINNHCPHNALTQLIYM